MGQRTDYRSHDGVPGIWGMEIHPPGYGRQNIQLHRTGRGHALERMFRGQAPGARRTGTCVPDDGRQRAPERRKIGAWPDNHH